MGKENFQDRIQQAINLHQTHQIEAASFIYKKILFEDPNHANALHLLGVALLQQQQYEAALSLLNRAIKVYPQFASAYSNRGIVLLELKRYEEALESYDKALVLNPNHADAYSNRGVVLRELKCYEEALESYDKALVLNPNHADAYTNRGVVLRDLKRYEEALESYDKALVLNPNHADDYTNRGVVLRDLKRYEEALESYDKALVLNPNHADVYTNRGVVLQELKRYEEALESYDKVLSINSNYSEAYSSRGNPLSLNSNHIDANFDKSLLLLLQGALLEGFQLYEYRWQREEMPLFSEPLWLGDFPLDGKTILIHGEQGFGDKIQFCRYIDKVIALGADVIFEVDKNLLSLFKQLTGVRQFVIKGDPLPPFDCHIPLLSLPLAFKTTLETIPADQAYLKADLKKRKAWGKRLIKDSVPKIGLAWSGSLLHKNDHNRTIPLEKLLPYLPVGNHYICLQKEIRESDQITLRDNPHIQFFGDELNDFSDTAALCDLMDMVISVDTSIAHLSAALGKPTTILLPFNPDWRWLLDRDDSPWYPTVRLLRQTQNDDWHSCLKQIKFSTNK